MTHQISDYDSEHIKSSELLDRLDGYEVLVALGTNSNLDGKGLPDDNNLASVLPLFAQVHIDNLRA